MSAERGTVEYLAELILEQTKLRLQTEYVRGGYTDRERYPDHPDVSPNVSGLTVKVTPGRVYTKVDVGGSGKYMVENATGIIFGIKGYGQVHKGHRYGTLETVDEWFWGRHVGVKAVG
jgi:hypothetical protein